MPKLISALLFLLFHLTVFSNDTIRVVKYSEDIDGAFLKNDLYILSDGTGKLDFKTIQDSKDFNLQPPGIVNLGLSNKVHWLRLDVLNTSNEPDLLLRIGHPTIDHLSLFILEDKSLIKLETGTAYPYSHRDFNHQDFIFDLRILPETQQRIYLRVQSSNPILLPITIGTKEVLVESLLIKDLFFGIYFGAILVMFFYNLFVYFSVKERSYLIYVVYIFVIGLIQATLGGYAFRLIFPDNPWLANQNQVILPALGGMLAIEFLKVFTHSKDLIPKMHQYFVVPHILFIVCIISSVLGFKLFASTLIQPSAMLASLYILISAVVMVKKGSRTAKFFLMAWAIFLVGIFIFVLKELGIIPYNQFSTHILEIGSALEVVLLSIGLADRINVFRREKEESQKSTLLALQENERIISEQNIMLETKVEERTAALKKANTNLNLALTNLKEAQSQLVSAEKMASLGQLTAGIAHEINNPINFVTSNIDPLKQNISELLELIDKYEVMGEEMSSVLGDSIKDITNYKEDIDLKYLIEETNDIIEGIKEGAERTAEIVLGLRTFSHVDDIGIKVVDLNKGITSTLQLLKGEINNGINIELELGDTKTLECYGGKINQVFMNVINNGIQAIKTKEDPKGTILIKTEDLREGVKVTISDEGIGMDEETKAKIFEPFFTTKDVGEGTGLGLSVVYGIIESHHGTVTVESELGKGTTFIINLPYKQPN